MSSRRYLPTGGRSRVPPPAPSPPGSDDERFPDTDELRRRARKLRREVESGSGSSRRGDDLSDRMNRMDLPDDETLRARFDYGTTPAPRTGEPRTSRRSRRDDYDNDLDPSKFEMNRACQEGTKRRAARPTTSAGQETPFVPQPQTRPCSPPMPGYDAPGYAGGPPPAPHIPYGSRSCGSTPRQPSQPKPRRESNAYPSQAGYQRHMPTAAAGPVPEFASPPPRPPRRPVPGYPMPCPPPMPGYPPPPRRGPMPGYAPEPGPYGGGPMPGPRFQPGPQRTRSSRRPGHSSRRRTNTSAQYSDIVPEISEPESEASDEEPQKLLEYK